MTTDTTATTDNRLCSDCSTGDDHCRRLDGVCACECTLDLDEPEDDPTVDEHQGDDVDRLRARITAAVHSIPAVRAAVEPDVPGGLVDTILDEITPLLNRERVTLPPAYANGDDGYLWLTCDRCETSLMEIDAGTFLDEMVDAVTKHRPECPAGHANEQLVDNRPADPPADEHHAELTETRAALARIAQQLGRAEAAIELVRALHRAEPDGADGRLYCVADDHPMPCPTRRALDAAR